MSHGQLIEIQNDNLKMLISNLPGLQASKQSSHLPLIDWYRIRLDIRFRSTASPNSSSILCWLCIIHLAIHPSMMTTILNLDLFCFFILPIVCFQLPTISWLNNFIIIFTHQKFFFVSLFSCQPVPSQPSPARLSSARPSGGHIVSFFLPAID